MIVESQLSDLDETVDVRQNTEIIGTDIDDLNCQICQLTQEVNTLHRCRKEIVSGGARFACPHVVRDDGARAREKVGAMPPWPPCFRRLCTQERNKICQVLHLQCSILILVFHHLIISVCYDFWGQQLTNLHLEYIDIT